MARVVLTRTLPFAAIERLAERHELTTWPERLPPPPERLRELAADADGLLCLLTDRIDAEFLDAAPNLKVVSNFAVGTDNVDLEAASARGIPVGYTPDVLTDATADLAFALLLASARRLPQAAAAIPAGDWVTWEPARWLGAEVSGATLGIVGMGRIGSAVARRAAGFGMTVLDARADGLDRLLERADFVSLHAPLTPQTRHLVDARALAKMRPTAHLVNTARGGLVDQEALARALHDGTIAGAALDVTDPEPLPPEHPLHAAPNLLLVPHVGSATHRTRERMAAVAVDNLLAGLAGEPMPHRANG
ncbi:MAG: D-glycerate dehydrogenase [Actinomycetota bacterium]|nr:D-glycerate dehydrogenase [Actinomycetota bacterium]